MSCFLILGSFRTGRTMVILLVYMNEMGYLRAGDFLTCCWIKQAESSLVKTALCRTISTRSLTLQPESLPITCRDTLFIARMTRPEISVQVNTLGRHAQGPTTIHLKEAYLPGISMFVVNTEGRTQAQQAYRSRRQSVRRCIIWRS